MNEKNAATREKRKADELEELRNEVAELLYAQAFASGDAEREAAVCETFQSVLKRRWHLSGTLTLLREKDEWREAGVCGAPQVCEALRRSSVSLSAACDGAKEFKAGTLFVVGAESAVIGKEIEFVRDEEARRSLVAAGVETCALAPAFARGELVGALVVVAENATDLTEALEGLRTVAAPLVAAVKNARRAVALREHQSRIENLVAELRERSDALEEANRELQRVARYRSLFLARMSHDIRTPLTAMLGFIEILLEHEDLTPTQRRYCEKVRASGVQLQASLNQLVDLSRLETEKPELFFHEFSAHEMLREACARVENFARKQGVDLDCDFDSAAGAIISDEGKLRQVVYSFLLFAIHRAGVRKAAGASQGRVAARARVVVEKEGVRKLFIELCDDGEPLDDPTRLLEPRAVPLESGAAMYELGLAVAYRIALALGAEVRIESLFGSEAYALRLTLELSSRD